jgi:hypothetical protein
MFAFPSLNRLKSEWGRMKETKLFHELHNNPDYIPIINHQRGYDITFEFENKEFFLANQENCLKVAAVYCFLLLGQKSHLNNYIVRYFEETQEVNIHHKF